MDGIVKLVGLAIVVVVLALLGTDLYAVLAKGATHPVVTREHVLMLFAALFGFSLTSDAVVARIVKVALAFRGKGGSDG
jgi:hypothetical protein